MLMNTPSMVTNLCKLLNDNGYQAYVVGGCVRDTFLNLQPKDWDITTNATPLQMKEVFKAYRVIETGMQHGTLTVHVDGENYEVTTYRTDGVYSDNRHPDSVTFTTSLEEDLARRDFTVNAMAYDPLTHALVDDYNGVHAIENRILECVGDANQRFQEDALRMMRAVRFACQKDFNIDLDTLHAIEDNAKLILNVSAERVKDELDKILMSDNAVAGMDSLYNYGLMNYVLPELMPMIDCQQNNPNHTTDVWRHTMDALEASIDADMDLLVRWAVLLHDSGKPSTKVVGEDGFDHFYGHPMKSKELALSVMNRLKFDTASRDTIAMLVEYHDSVLAETKASVKRFMNKGLDFERWVNVKYSDIYGHSNETRQAKLDNMDAVYRLYTEIKNYKEPFSVKDLAINGNDVMTTLNIEPSRKVGQILTALLDMVVESPELNNREVLLNIIMRS